MRRHQEDTSSLRSRGNWSSMRWGIPQGAWDLRLVFLFTSQHLVWPEDRARPADHGAHGGWSLHYQHPAPGHQLRATPTCSLSGCDKPTGGSPPVDKLVQNGLSSSRAAGGLCLRQTRRGRKESGRAFIDELTDCKESQGGGGGRGRPPRAPRCGCCGRPVSMGLRVLKNWMKGQRVLPGV